MLKVLQSQRLAWEQIFIANVGQIRILIKNRALQIQYVNIYSKKQNSVTTLWSHFQNGRLQTHKTNMYKLNKRKNKIT